MPNYAKINIACNLCRCISTGGSHFNKYFSRESKFMGKIMNGDRGKRKWYKSDENAVTLPGPFTMKKSAVPQNARRVTVLNKLFMKYITDLMATGEVAPEILGKGIEISRVKMSPDFNQVNVFWLAKGTEEKNAEVEEILAKSAFVLRHELSQLRVIGLVPIIKFVKDKQYARIIEVDQKLALADFGEDYEPVDPARRLKTEPVLNAKLSPEVRSRIEELENLEEDEVEVFEEPLPEMRGDVLGLNHFSIMSKVKNSMDKSVTAARNRAANTVAVENREAENDSVEVMEYLTAKEQRDAFSEFLKKRQIQEKQKKRMGLEKNYLPERELMFEEWQKRNAENDYDFDSDFDEDRFE